MDTVEVLLSLDGTWHTEYMSWDDLVQVDGVSHSRFIFTSADVLTAIPPPLRTQILSKFGIPAFLLNRIYLESNGFCGHDFTFHENNSIRSYTYYSRFIIKQTYDPLRPKQRFRYRHSSLELLKAAPFKSPTKQYDTAIHSKQSIPDGWEWYEMGFFVHWTTQGNITMLTLDVPAHMKSALKRALYDSTEDVKAIDPYVLFSKVVDALVELYNDSVWAIRNHVSACEINRPRESDYSLLHEIARHAIHVSETLEVALENLTASLRQQEEFWEIVYNDIISNDSKLERRNRLKFLHGFLAGLLKRNESNVKRIQNEITMAFNTGAQRESQIQVRIAESAGKEAKAMKAIAVLTMTFLPATFVSSVFSMSFFYYEPAKSGENSTFVVSDKFWIYWVLAAPLSLVTLAAWFFWETRLKKSTA